MEEGKRDRKKEEVNERREKGRKKGVKVGKRQTEFGIGERKGHKFTYIVKRVT